MKRVQEELQQERKRLTDLRKRREKLDQVISDIQRRLDYHLNELEGL